MVQLLIRFPDWSEIVKNVALFLAYSILMWVQNADAACTKFSSHSDFFNAVEVDGVCFYAFSGTWQYSAAENLCSSEGTKLPNFEEERKQMNVYSYLGTEYRQHWIGLKHISDVWTWWDATTGIGTTMTSDRWGIQNAPSTGQCAFSDTNEFDGRGSTYKSTSCNNFYMTVCEDVAATPMKVTPTTEAVVTTPTTEVPTPLTTSTPEVPTPLTTSTSEVVVDGCNGQQYEVNKNFRMANYRKTEVLCSVEEIGQTEAESLLDCARRCLRAPGCCSFAFNMKVCRHFRFVRGREDSLCPGQESCFSFV